MAYRFTNTDKWVDAWFSNLKPTEKLLFIYLCDNCDIAGFIEYIPKRWSIDTGINEKAIEGALKGLQRGLVWSNDNDCIYIINFLKHQKNIPLNSANKSHVGILRRFDKFVNKFDIQDINEFIKAPTKPLQRGTGNGNGIDSGILEEKPEEKKEPTWRDDFSVYLKEGSSEFNKFANDKSFLLEQHVFYPEVHLQKTMQKAWTNYWGTERGWKKKKSSKTVNIDWKDTIVFALSQPINKVYYTKQELLELEK